MSAWSESLGSQDLAVGSSLGLAHALAIGHPTTGIGTLVDPRVLRTEPNLKSDAEAGPWSS